MNDKKHAQSLESNSSLPHGFANEIGSLYLIPTPLGENFSEADYADSVRTLVVGLKHFVVENEKTARRFLKQIGVLSPIAELKLGVLNEHTKDKELEALLMPLMQGEDVGLVSEAGCPCVADPGANLVRLAHAKGASVKPLVGPSSILLALMACGLNGQRFAFHGYAPVDPGERRKFLLELERESRSKDQTQIFMDTPYRNDKLARDVISACDSGTYLCVASDLTQAGEKIATRLIRDWRKSLPEIGKVPSLFLLYAGRGQPRA